MKKIYFTDDDMCTTRKLSISRVQAFYLQNGWEVTENPDNADLIAVLTCSGWNELEERSIERLKSYRKYGDKVVSVGCTNDANPSAIASVFQGRVVSGRNIEDLCRFEEVPKIPLEDIAYASTFRRKEDYRLYDLSKRFVNIAEGCSFDCSFCTHKPGLGPKRSRDKESIVAHVRSLINEGMKTLVLTGMETSMYGREIGLTYPDLLEEIFELGGIFRIHIAQFTPTGVHFYNDRLTAAFSNPRISDIQIPIQTTSSRLLKMMKRPVFAEELNLFIKKIRAKNPKVILRTDIIVGFPSETIDELKATLEYAVELFDEIAVYGCELAPNRPVMQYESMQLSLDEMRNRVEYAKSFITLHGLLAHSGQQESADLKELEFKKELMRQQKGQNVDC